MSRDTHALARRLRGHALHMTHRARASHIGSCMSMADIMAVLYGGALRFDAARPDWPQRDRLVVSKGHAAAIVYASLAESGFFPVAELETYCTDGSRLPGHVSKTVPGIEISTGSLGHGLPAAGMPGECIVRGEIAQREAQPSLRAVRQGHVVFAGGQTPEFVAHAAPAPACPRKPFTIG